MSLREKLDTEFRANYEFNPITVFVYGAIARSALPAHPVFISRATEVSVKTLREPEKYDKYMALDDFEKKLVFDNSLRILERIGAIKHYQGGYTATDKGRDLANG